jgi:hypothetical protein
MATITSTPVQIPSDGQALQFSSQVNPFYAEVGSSLYQVLYSNQGTSPAKSVHMLKRATATTGGAWVEQDVSHSPDVGHQTGVASVSVLGTTIAICYLILVNNTFGNPPIPYFKICEYDTLTDTWGTPTAQIILPSLPQKFVFVQRSDLTYVVVGGYAFRIYVITNTAGVWSSINFVRNPGGLIVNQGWIDSSNNIWFRMQPQEFIFDFTENTVTLAQVSSTYLFNMFPTITDMLTGSRDGSVPLVYALGPTRYSTYPSMILWAGTTIATAYLGLDGNVHVRIGTTLAAPGTDYTVYTPAAGEKTTYWYLAEGLDGSLNLFFISVNPTVPSNRIMQSVFDGASAWSTSVFYDAIANPPINGILPANNPAQVMQTLQAVELTAGWTATTAMVIQDIPSPPATFYSAEFLESGVSPPPPGTITCQITIFPPGPPGPGQVSVKALRYQIPQRRWFPHTYND